MKLIIQAMCFVACCALDSPLYSQDASHVQDTSNAYVKILKKSTSTQGFFNIHRVEDRVYFEIPDAMLDIPVMIVNRIAQGSSYFKSETYMAGYTGDEIGRYVVQFSKGPKNLMFIKKVYVFEQSQDSSDNGMYRSIQLNSLQPIAAAVKIEGRSNANSSLIPMTDLMISEDNLFGFEHSFYRNVKSPLALGAIEPEKSYIKCVQSFTTNIEIQSIKTFKRTGSYGGSVTYEINSSLILLPQQPLRPRLYDHRVGYFSVPYIDFDADPTGGFVQNQIKRWRLEPKDPENYLKGHLSEPVKPIIFYIDPTTPAKWVPYLIAGIQDWQIAFEQAGFKNAIVAKKAPGREEDSTWSLYDARHSAVIYKPSVAENASGPVVEDPRTGEILESHINWYHSVMRLVRDWYFVQASPLDPHARSMQLNDTLMGKLIRYVIAHETGHVLGLQHNFGASASVPVDSLRNNQWLTRNGICPSIMDYARVNYVAQPEDSVSVDNLISKIGVYDRWAIEWGYRWVPDTVSFEREQQWLHQWVSDQLKDPRLRFGTELINSDPRNQSEDLGDDPVKASRYGIMNLKRIIPHLKEWTKVETGGYEHLERMYKKVFDQFKKYLLHVTKLVGGCMYTARKVNDTGSVRSYVDKTIQKKAVAFILSEVVNPPDWILDKEIFSLTDQGSLYKLQTLQKSVFEKLMSHTVFGNLLWFQTEKGSAAYTVQELLHDIETGVWDELMSGKPIHLYKRNVQKIYVEQLIQLLDPYKKANAQTVIDDFYKYNRNTDILSLIRGQLMGLQKKINTVKHNYPDRVTRLHLEDISDRLKKAIDEK